MKFQVLGTDIVDAVVGRLSRNPIALAAQRITVPDNGKLLVGQRCFAGDYRLLAIRTRPNLLLLPPEAVRFLLDFHLGKQVAPLVFEAYSFDREIEVGDMFVLIPNV